MRDITVTLIIPETYSDCATIGQCSKCYFSLKRMGKQCLMEGELAKPQYKRNKDIIDIFCHGLKDEIKDGYIPKTLHERLSMKKGGKR